MLFKLILVVCGLSLAAAQFDEDTSKNLANFVSAAFTSTMNHNNPEAKACFNKSYPDGNWFVLNAFNLSPCPIKDQCALWIVSSDIYKMMVFAFKGTISKDEMNKTAYESPFKYVPYTIGNVSYGQVNADTLKASQAAFNYISSLIYGHRHYKFAFTGHSLGGAIASLTALNAQIAIKLDNLVVYTFGQPRYHDYQLAQTFKSHLTSYYRVINNWDVVPALPLCYANTHTPCDRANSSYHSIQEIWYNNVNLTMSDGEYRSCSLTDGEDIQCSDHMSFDTYTKNLGTDQGMAIHMTYYNNNLKDYGLLGCGPCVDIDTDCVSKNECKNSLYKPLMCKYCRKTCNFCIDQSCNN